MRIFGNFGLIAAIFLGLSPPASSNDFTTFFLRYWTVSARIEAYRMDLYREYSECSKTAIERAVSMSEAEACADLYLRLKLSFLPGSEYNRFKTLSAATRAYAHEKAYAAYRAWLHRHVSGYQPTIAGWRAAN